MKLTGISNTGLVVISLLVALLWGVIFAERSYTREAREEYKRYQRALPAKPAKVKPEPPGRVVPRGLPSHTFVS